MMTKYQHLGKSPNAIFIHSLFRSGSTFLFSVFRRSNKNYWCYQEPITEMVLFNKDNPDNLLEYFEESSIKLRHPSLIKPYYFELYQVWEHCRHLITKSVIYDQYFDNIGGNDLINYLNALILYAKGIPLIQECRTSCRIEAIKNKLGGFHIFLWRNPWDQWWSYKVNNYFDTIIQLIINASPCPKSIHHLKKNIDFIEFHHDNIQEEFAHFNRRPLSAENSYASFYLLWCLALFEGMANADLLINIDILSDSSDYRDYIKKQLSISDITDIDLSDCFIPQTFYEENEKEIFFKIEELVHDNLLLSGYPSEQIIRLKELRQSSQPKLWASGLTAVPPEQLFMSAVRAREIAFRLETENGGILYQVSKDLDEERTRSVFLYKQWKASKAKEDDLNRRLKSIKASP